IKIRINQKLLLLKNISNRKVVGIHLYTRVKNLSMASMAPSKGSSLNIFFKNLTHTGKHLQFI
ncbi:hypothetical protein NL388_34970, partial [Klebsiella pneumoniae]|nr:hypothetical protein [Klebsiella pneumoniae]